MSVKSFCLGGLVVTVLGLAAARGQDPASPLSVNTNGPPPYAPQQAGPQPELERAPPGAPPVRPLGQLDPPNSWLVYPRPANCCGPVGHNGPIGSEVYLRSGGAFPVGGGPLNQVLLNGWAIEGGARVLFFNPAMDRAWTLDGSILNINNNSVDTDHVFPLFNVPARTTGANGQTTTTNVPEIDVTVSGLNQTFVNLSVGREWWLVGSGSYTYNGASWRAGIDGGGRYGTARLDFNEIRHTTDTLGGLFFAVHSDLEFPCGCVIFQAGVRAEYGYVWSDLLQRQTNSDLQMITLLGTLGIRF